MCIGCAIFGALHKSIVFIYEKKWVFEKNNCLVIGVAEFCVNLGALCCILYETTPMHIIQVRNVMSFSSRFSFCPFLYTQI